jgi:exodeoxyribonuclease VII large subunit
MTGNGPTSISAAARATVVSNLPEYTVGEISLAIKRTLEGSFERVRVRGEVSRPNYHGSGHLYLTLKDADAAMDAVAWRMTVGRLGIHLEEGMEIIATGRISSYPKSSKYQLVIDSVELAGEGALLKLLEDRRKRLAAEGLFDEARKTAIPFLPSVIGVVTSPTGAVIRDILHRVTDRFPRHVILWPVPVQGEGAAEKIAAAIRGFNAIQPGGTVPRPDVLIVARGGGSLEDLWCFNEEIVVRAAAASEIPLISAVGHETDTTLIDFASDLRAPTPTAAAEMAVPVRAELVAQVLESSRRAVGAMARALEERRTALRAEARGLPDPQRLLEEANQHFDDVTQRLGHGLRRNWERHSDELKGISARLPVACSTLMKRCADRFESLDAAGRMKRAARRFLDDATRHLAHAARVLDGLSYQRVLERGFVLVCGPDAEPVTSAKATAPGMALELRFHDGEVPAVVGHGAVPRGKKKKTGGDGGGQGSLL